MTKRFPIGFWDYATTLDKPAADMVKDWTEAGMTLAMSPHFGTDSASLEKMRAILELAARADIRVILCPEAGYWPQLTKVGEEAYRRDFAALVHALDHPAVFGFLVGDEPGTAEFADACRAMRIQRELAPDLQPFLNLLPMFPGSESRVGYRDWGGYLDDYVAAARPLMLSYDYYAQLNPRAPSEEVGGFEYYFANLRTHWEAALRHGIDFWTTLLSVGHFLYRCPSEDDLRWQLNTAVAHGAKGLLWFFFAIGAPHYNYRVSPIDEHGERTETYAWLSRVCRTFLNWHAPVLQECRLLRAQHIGKAWGGWPLFDGQGRLANAHSSTGTPLIFSEFSHTGGAEYLAVVNNSQQESTFAQFTIRGQHPNLHHVGWRGQETPLLDAAGNGVEHGVDYLKLQCWLAPGQMEMYRVEE